MRLVVDSHHNTPREMTFESTRVRKRHYELVSTVSIPHNSQSDSHAFQKRDAFCQLLQLMKARHSQLSEPDMISVFVGTWNMGKKSPVLSGRRMNV